MKIVIIVYFTFSIKWWKNSLFLSNYVNNSARTIRTQPLPKRPQPHWTVPEAYVFHCANKIKWRNCSHWRYRGKNVSFCFTEVSCVRSFSIDAYLMCLHSLDFSWRWYILRLLFLANNRLSYWHRDQQLATSEVDERIRETFVINVFFTIYTKSPYMYFVLRELHQKQGRRSLNSPYLPYYYTHIVIYLSSKSPTFSPKIASLILHTFFNLPYQK